MPSFIFEAGISTRVCLAVTALRMRVSISATGSVIFMDYPPLLRRREDVCLAYTFSLLPAKALRPGVRPLNSRLDYQLDFVTPGSSPRKARSRKQIRHRPNLRIYARGRPQTLQRLCCCTLNLGLRFAFTIIEIFAINALHYYFLKGM